MYHSKRKYSLLNQLTQTFKEIQSLAYSMWKVPLQLGSVLLQMHVPCTHLWLL